MGRLSAMKNDEVTNVAPSHRKPRRANHPRPQIHTSGQAASWFAAPASCLTPDFQNASRVRLGNDPCAIETGGALRSGIVRQFYRIRGAYKGRQFLPGNEV